jgi:hypothetical protein
MGESTDTARHWELELQAVPGISLNRMPGNERI